MPRTIVTGAAGFLGSHLVDSLLEDRYDVVGIDDLSTGRMVNLADARRSPRFRFRRANVTTLERLPRADRYFHLASPASPRAYADDPIGTLLVNSAGAHHVLEAARRADARVLMASTSEVYGDPEVHPQRESYWGHVNSIGPRSCYDEAKRFSEALSMAYRREYGLDVRIARIFNTYGPRMDSNDGRVVSNFIVQGLQGKPFTIYGRGQQTRSYCYVTDLVRGLRLLMDAPPATPSPMNLGQPREMTILETARQVARALNVPAAFEFRPIPEDDPARRRPDIGRARKYLNWTPKTSFRSGLAKTVAYFRASGVGPGGRR